MKLLIVTTYKDISLDPLLSAAEAAGVGASILFYDRIQGHQAAASSVPGFDVVYFRDPFNSGSFDVDLIEHAIKAVTDANTSAKYIDNIKRIDDIMIEDKWIQYQLLSKFMPDTTLLGSKSAFIDGRHIAKPRVSSRGRGIVFSSDDIEPETNYVLQPIVAIETEYRVYGVHGSVKELAAIRTPKTVNSKVKVSGLEQAPPDVIEFTSQAYELVPQMQLVGFDIIRTVDGRLMLIEVNRSPQFSRYNEISDTNLAEEFMKGLYE